MSEGSPQEPLLKQQGHDQGLKNLPVIAVPDPCSLPHPLHPELSDPSPPPEGPLDGSDPDEFVGGGRESRNQAVHPQPGQEPLPTSTLQVHHLVAGGYTTASVIPSHFKKHLNFQMMTLYTRDSQIPPENF